MSEIAYMSKVRIERRKGPLRIAHLPGESRPIEFSVHGDVAKHYGVDEDGLGESHATTLDYVVAATGGWMVGTFGGALEARKIDASDGRLTADVRGEVEAEDGVLVLRRIHVDLKVRAPEQARETVERVHRFFASKCPVFRSLSPAIKISSSCTLVSKEDSIKS